MDPSLIIVKKGLHPANYDVVPDIHKTINTSNAWFELGVTLIAKENEDLDMNVVCGTVSYLDQGSYFIFDTIKDLNKYTNMNLTICFRNLYINGAKQTHFGDVSFQDDVDIEDANIVLDVRRDANVEKEELKYVYTVYRDGNKRTLRCMNKEDLLHRDVTYQ